MSEALQYRIERLFAEYAGFLDDGPLDEWPALFMEGCLYLVIPRENFDQGLPLAIMRAESRGMLEDRVRSVRETIMHEPRYLRHQVTNIRINRQEGSQAEVQANYSLIEVLQDELPRILSVGRYLSLIDTEKMRFREQRVVYDSVMVPNTVVYPI